MGAFRSGCYTSSLATGAVRSGFRHTGRFGESLMLASILTPERDSLKSLKSRALIGLVPAEERPTPNGWLQTVATYAIDGRPATARPKPLKLLDSACLFLREHSRSLPPLNTRKVERLS